MLYLYITENQLIQCHSMFLKSRSGCFSSLLGIRLSAAACKAVFIGADVNLHEQVVFESVQNLSSGFAE